MKDNDEDQRQIVKELKGIQENKSNPYNDSRDSQHKLSVITIAKGSHGTIEHQSKPMLIEAEVHEESEPQAQHPSSTLKGTFHHYI